MNDFQSVAVKSVLVKVQNRYLFVVQHSRAFGLVGCFLDGGVRLDFEQVDEELRVGKEFSCGLVGLHLSLVGIDRFVILEIPDRSCHYFTKLIKNENYIPCSISDR